MKHTPGPWEATRCNDDCLIMEVTDTTGWREKYPFAYIAKLGGWGYCEKNAQLIAAAPDMYEALEWISKHPKWLAELDLETQIKIKDAFNKAKGEL